MPLEAELSLLEALLPPPDFELVLLLCFPLVDGIIVSPMIEFRIDLDQPPTTMRVIGSRERSMFDALRQTHQKRPYPIAAETEGRVSDGTRGTFRSGPRVSISNTKELQWVPVHQRKGAAGTTDQSSRREDHRRTRSAALAAKDKPDRNRDANGKSNNDPEVKKVSDGSKQKSDDRA